MFHHDTYVEPERGGLSITKDTSFSSADIAAMSFLVLSYWHERSMRGLSMLAKRQYGQQFPSEINNQIVRFMAAGGFMVGVSFRRVGLIDWPDRISVDIHDLRQAWAEVIQEIEWWIAAFPEVRLRFQLDMRMYGEAWSSQQTAIVRAIDDDNCQQFMDMFGPRVEFFW